MRNPLTLIACVLVAVVALVGCKKAASETSGPIRVGVILPFSGDLASYGKTARDGLEQRLEEINSAGGIDGRMIELIYQDDRADPSETRKAFVKLATTDGVCAVIGPLTSTCAIQARFDAEKEKVPLITPTATNDAVTANAPYVFRTIYNDSFQGRVAGSFVAKDLKLTKAAVLTDKNSDYSKGLSEQFTKAFEAAGGKVVASEGYQQKDASFGGQLQKAKDSGAQILFVPGYPPEVPQIIKQAKVAGFEGRLCGGDGWDDEDVLQKAGDNIVGCYFVGAFAAGDDRPEVQKFREAMKERTGRDPGGFEALAYDSLTLVADAVRAAGSSNPQKVQAALLTLKDIPLITGTATISPQGDAVHTDAVVMEVVKDGDHYGKKLVGKIAP